MNRIALILAGLIMIVSPPAAILLSGENPIYLAQFLAVPAFGLVILFYGLRKEAEDE
ncbi:MAG TPA: hypothetical protein VEH01_01195 [Nitrososphaerales archaeon]|nr:hypothetical protein [Nitrososphaerales archaeon]